MDRRPYRATPGEWIDRAVRERSPKEQAALGALAALVVLVAVLEVALGATARNARETEAALQRQQKLSMELSLDLESAKGVAARWELTANGLEADRKDLEDDRKDLEAEVGRLRSLVAALGRVGAVQVAAPAPGEIAAPSRPEPGGTAPTALAAMKIGETLAAEAEAEREAAAAEAKADAEAAARAAAARARQEALAKTTKDREAIRNVNMVGVWAVMSPPRRAGGPYAVSAYTWLFPDGRMFLLSAADCAMIGAGHWEHDDPYFVMIDGDGRRTEMLILSVPITRTWGQRIFFDLVAAPWEFVDEDPNTEC